MNMFKLSSVILVATLVVGSALGCGSADNSNKSQSQDESDVQTD